MSHLPMNPLSQEEQQRLMREFYLLLGKQVKSYHKHRSLGDNSSVPVELAQELTASMEYTLNLAGGLYAGRNIEEALMAGQDILDARVQKAKSMFQLVTATAPRWHTECRWEALKCIEQYLATYEHLHLAHREPDALFYPMLVSVPESVRGIDHCLFCLNVLWLENQIMAGFEDTALEQLWSRLPTNTLNQCEHLLINGIGKAVIHTAFDYLVFEEQERESVGSMLRGKTPAQIKKLLNDAALRLCGWLDLSNDAAAYAQAVVPQLTPRLEGALMHDDLSAIFL